MQKNCIVCGKLCVKKYHESRKYWAKRKYCSRPCADSVVLWKPGHIPWIKGRKHPQVLGSLNNNWKGGITSINEKLRKSTIYKLWKNAVFEKDNYTCQICDKRGGNLHAHHIKPFAVYVDLRFAIDNGQTLCIPCHKSINHTKLLNNN